MPILGTDRVVSAAFDVELTADDWWVVVEAGVTRVNENSDHSAVIAAQAGAEFDAFVQNSGTILSNHAGVWFRDSGGSLINTSTGVIHSVNDMAIVAFSESDNAIEINNAGLIRSSRSTAISGSNAADTIINTGVIEGPGGTGIALALHGGTDHVINRGVIFGDVELSANSSHRDLFDGRGGIVTGDVSGGRGNDTYIVDQTDISLVEKSTEGIDEVRALVSWTLDKHFETLTLLGGADIDGTGTLESNTITGNGGDNTLSGLRGHDLIHGGAGDDRLIGHRGNDTLMGDTGDDFLSGRDGYDDLQGGDGDDVLKAGRHQDRLDGGTGADTLNGGPGGDTLTGGDGADVFEFRVMRHSLITQSERDVILDFEDDVDRIDLTAFDLSFAKAGFTGTMPEVRYTNLGDEDIQVRIDVDGDGLNDMRIDILGVRGLSINDLIL